MVSGAIVSQSVLMSVLPKRVSFLSYFTDEVTLSRLDEQSRANNSTSDPLASSILIHNFGLGLDISELFASR